MLQYKRAATEHDQSNKSAEIKKGGLDALLGTLQQAKKVNVLDKSRMDWGDFKSSDVQVHPNISFTAACCTSCVPACHHTSIQQLQHSPAKWSKVHPMLALVKSVSVFLISLPKSNLQVEACMLRMAMVEGSVLLS